MRQSNMYRGCTLSDPSGHSHGELGRFTTVLDLEPLELDERVATNDKQNRGTKLHLNV